MTDHTPRAVIIHVSDAPADLARATDNARLVAEQYPGARVRVIINGAALEGLRTADGISVPEGIEVGACAIGLGRRGIDASSLPVGVEVVPAAVPAIVAAQLEGAVYVRI
jgi:intracellular sulfur oxidation DsrE/DsrF family protein